MYALQAVVSLTDGQRDVQLVGSISGAELFAHQERLEQAGVFVALLPAGLAMRLFWLHLPSDTYTLPK